MITADALARELGCTLADLEDLDPFTRPLQSQHLFFDVWADELRAAWSKKAGLDYSETVQ